MPVWLVMNMFSLIMRIMRKGIGTKSADKKGSHEEYGAVHTRNIYRTDVA